jgi:hypothetical protein
MIGLLRSAQRSCYFDVRSYSARAGESVPIEIDGNGYGQIAVSDLIAPQP